MARPGHRPSPHRAGSHPRGGVVDVAVVEDKVEIVLFMCASVVPFASPMPDPRERALREVDALPTPLAFTPELFPASPTGDLSGRELRQAAAASIGGRLGLRVRSSSTTGGRAARAPAGPPAAERGGAGHEAAPDGGARTPTAPPSHEGSRRARAGPSTFARWARAASWGRGARHQRGPAAAVTRRRPFGVQCRSSGS